MSFWTSQLKNIRTLCERGCVRNRNQRHESFRLRLKEALHPSGNIRFDILLFFASFIAYFFASDIQLNDYDAVNYALAVREFNVALDMPHPPGAPLFVAVVKCVNLFVGNIPLSLCLTSAWGGAVFVLLWRRIFDFFLSPRSAAVGAIVLAISPGMWMTASQPMSDALAAALLSSTVLMALYYARSARPIVFLAFTALLALTVGVRPQYGILAIFMLFASMFYCRVPRQTLILSLITFTVVNLAWLVPTIYSQYNLDGTGWQTYTNQIMRFQSGFGAASGSPLLSENIDIKGVLFRAATHVGALGYFGLGLNLWYPDSVGLSLQTLGTELNPWYTDTAEWTLEGSIYTLVYFICAIICFSRVKYYAGRVRGSESYLGYLLLFAIAYFIFVVMLVPPHIRFYLPVMPFFILIALLGAQSGLLQNKVQYILLFCAVASTLPTLRESIQISAPPVALMQQIQKESNDTGANTVLFLNTNASRHALWYLPDAQIYRGEDDIAPIDLDKIFAQEKRVFSNYATAATEYDASITKVERFRRPYRVWMRHTSTSLFEITAKPRVLALDTESINP